MWLRKVNNIPVYSTWFNFTCCHSYFNWFLLVSINFSSVDKFLCEVDDIAVSPARIPFKERVAQLRCDVCDKLMLSLSSLNYHKRTYHSNKMFKCQSCAKARYFKYLKNLIDHAAISHDRLLLAIEKKAVNPPKKQVVIKCKNHRITENNSHRNPSKYINHFQFSLFQASVVTNVIRNSIQNGKWRSIKNWCTAQLSFVATNAISFRNIKKILIDTRITNINNENNSKL